MKYIISKPEQPVKVRVEPFSISELQKFLDQEIDIEENIKMSLNELFDQDDENYFSENLNQKLLGDNQEEYSLICTSCKVVGTHEGEIILHVQCSVRG